MRDEAFLHIRSRDGRATRIVPLSGPSVRVGRGRSCEVRLDDPTLAEVEFLLRRRGDSYHLQPVRPDSRLTIDGRPADRPRPLAMGTTLRLADRWLTLLPTDDAPELDGNGPDAPPGEAPEAFPPGAESGAEAEPDPDPDEPEALDGRREELARWESRLKQRERWLSDRLHERQWEARWRAAGASLKARSRPADAASPRPRSAPRPAPIPTPTVAPGPPIRPRRGVEPAPYGPPTARVDRPTSGLPPAPAPAPPPRAVVPPIARPGPTAPRPRSESPGPEGPGPVPRAIRLIPKVVEAPTRRPGLALSFPPEVVETVIEIDESDPEPADQRPGPVDADPEGPGCLAEGLAIDPDLAESVETDRGVAESVETDPGSAEATSIPIPEPPERGNAEAECPTIPVAIGASTLAVVPSPDLDPAVDSGSGLPESRSDASDAEAPEVSTGLMPSGVGGEPVGLASEAEAVETRTGPEAVGGEASAWLSVPMLGLNDLVSFLSRSARPGTQDGPPAGGGEARGGPIEDAVGAVETASPTGPEEPSEEAVVPHQEVRDEDEVEDEVEQEQEEATAWAAGPAEATGTGPSGGPSNDWPSANAILGARPGRGPRRAASRARKAASFPEPTGRISPDEWTIPGGAWLCIPMMFAALAAGVVGVRLAWTWAVLDRESGRIADRLASGKRPEAGSIDLLLERELELPMASWRNSTADAMVARAALLAGPGPGADPASQERAGGLIHAAGAASPNHPGLRFARAWRAVQEPGADAPSLAVGLSRDIWPLAWSGRALLAAGKQDEARRCYLKALDLACRASPDESPAPVFHGEPQGGRFGMPLEGILGVVVSDMADRPEWSSGDWLGLIPDSSVAWLVATRVLRQRGDGEADRALERAIALADSPAPGGCSEAIHLAAVAEAMALDGRVEEAVEGYRRAVDRLTAAEESARRPWLFNLAELLGRLDDRDGEREALLAAMTTDPDDPVTAEAIRAQLRRGVDLVGAGPDGGTGGGGEGDRRDTFGE
ncbi:FHA domain-containing protein [Tautonia plasticadhaerens]|uniref:FHA domain-containing protein n=1 Tax=Tautonia plasticadhaerens TaxID=2527974 RepID=A0A518GYX8_9BACT|nr:FHA domain-containing protein [Tautonia plasticadhaerens]QDV33816.1 hypothetical protein ElP_16950 [Tautonia plasticadhaerens]